ncbi:sideroflexin-4 [Cebus imitator]|uniref:sideroflexin-4 n=1 Tax=Cebus imitator TaxID=2715852 RepID=UPI00080A3DA9|nr:sideroflexin-4 [Cebus imitator]
MSLEQEEEAQPGRLLGGSDAGAYFVEPNVRFWINERQSFIQRFLKWTEESIENLRQLLCTNEDASRSALEDQRIQEAWKRSLSTVHPDSSNLIPNLFRPAAFLPFMVPAVFFSMMPPKGIASMILPKVYLYAYLTAFSIINGNRSYTCHPLERSFLGVAAFASSSFIGLIPNFIQMRFSLNTFFMKRIVPAAVHGQVSGMNVFTSRSLETTKGIAVMDKEGHVLGHSKIAGQKAIRETTVSRGVLLGTSALIPEVFTVFFKRTPFSRTNAGSLWIWKLACTVASMGLMLPISFSLFPQVGRIQCSQLEEDIQSLTEETELFYHRGL